MFHFRKLDVYRCAVAFLPKAYAIAKSLDGEMASQPEGDALLIKIVSMLTKMIG